MNSGHGNHSAIETKTSTLKQPHSLSSLFSHLYVLQTSEIYQVWTYAASETVCFIAANCFRICPNVSGILNARIDQICHFTPILRKCSGTPDDLRFGALASWQVPCIPQCSEPHFTGVPLKAVPTPDCSIKQHKNKSVSFPLNNTDSMTSNALVICEINTLGHSD